MKNTILIKKSDLDQFYTDKKIAKDCFDKIFEIYKKRNFSIFFEPSAGDGAFFKLFPKTKAFGIDLDPKCKNILKQDFFDFVPDFTEKPNHLSDDLPIFPRFENQNSSRKNSFSKNKKIITIGNPPFGKNASLAIKFFNKAAEFSNVIAFIIPKTFRKESVQKKLNAFFYLKFDMDVPKNSFLLNGEHYDVPCCFQIWEKQKIKKEHIKQNLSNNYFDFSKKSDADFAIRRVGGRSGKAFLEIDELSESSNYFLKYKGRKKISDFISIVNSIDFQDIINSTAGVRSLSKPELIKKISEVLVGFNE